MREEENRAPDAFLFELLEMREGCEGEMERAGVLDGMDRGVNSGGMGQLCQYWFWV